MAISMGVLAAFGLYAARTSALVVSAPILGLGTRFAGHKIALILALALMLYAVSGQPLAADVPPFAYGALALREVLIGLFLSFLLSLTLLAVRVAGELIGHEMGFMVARQVDPATGVQTPLITSFYENLFLVALLALDGHHWLIRALGESFERAPVGHLALGAGVVPAIQRMLGDMFQAGIVFAAPVLVLLVLTSILIGLLSRAVPQLNVLEVGFTVRVLLAMVAMFLFAPLLEPAMTSLRDQLLAWLGRGLDALEV
jgi:flagellar biosynthetic protein FliR